MKKEKKEVAQVMQTPSKIVNVVFTIPTSFSYESVKVEISGVAENAELVEKYNELVELFRPKPKPVVPAPAKEPMRPYTVARKVPAADDEVNGAVNREEIADENTIALQKQDIVELLEKNHGFVCKGKTRKAISDRVFEITGLLLEDSNLAPVIDGLK